MHAIRHICPMDAWWFYPHWLQGSCFLAPWHLFHGLIFILFDYICFVLWVFVLQVFLNYFLLFVFNVYLFIYYCAATFSMASVSRNCRWHQIIQDISTKKLNKNINYYFLIWFHFFFTFFFFLFFVNWIQFW